MNRKTSQNNEKMPVLFIGHGSPMNIIQENRFTESLRRLGQSLPKPKAIMVISAHWLTEETCVTCTKKPRTIYDFYGFPDGLYKLTYPSAGAPSYAKSVTKLVKTTKVKCDTDWGLDHASWAILRHIYPQANVPVFEMSLDYSFNEWHPKPLQYHYDLASQLAELRMRGILIIGSGNIVHNLRLLNFDEVDAEPYDWAVEFDETIKQLILSGDHDSIIHYQNLGKAARLAVPTNEHYLPLLYVLAVQDEQEPIRFFTVRMTLGAISMRSVWIE